MITNIFQAPRRDHFISKKGQRVITKQSYKIFGIFFVSFLILLLKFKKSFSLITYFFPYHFAVRQMRLCGQQFSGTHLPVDGRPSDHPSGQQNRRHRNQGICPTNAHILELLFLRNETKNL